MKALIWFDKQRRRSKITNFTKSSKMENMLQIKGK